MTGRDDRTVKLFVRLDPTVGLESQKEQLLDRLRTLSDRGAIADYDVISLPAICLSVYESDDGIEVVDVYPRRADGQLESVDDGLDSLRSVSPRTSGQ